MGDLWFAGFWLSWIVGGLVAGALSGAIALWSALRRGQPGLGMLAFFICCITGAAGGVVVAVPVSLAFMWLIGRRARRAEAAGKQVATGAGATGAGVTGAGVAEAAETAEAAASLREAGSLRAAGASEGWRYAASGMLVAYFWFVIGLPIAAAIVLLTESHPSPYWSFTALLSTHVPMLAGLLLAVRRIHRRPLVTLIGAAGRVRWGKIGTALGVWSGIIAALSVTEMVARPGHAVLTLQMSAWLPFALFALPLIVMQCVAEELLFRGFIVQGLSAVTRRRAIVAGVSSLLFVAVHFPPTLAMASYYFIFGLFLTWVVLRDQGLESAIGIHIGHNLLAILLFPSVDNVLPFAEFPSVFRVVSPNDALSLGQLVLAMAVFSGIYFGLGRRAAVKQAVAVPARVASGL